VLNCVSNAVLPSEGIAANFGSILFRGVFLRSGDDRCFYIVYEKLALKIVGEKNIFNPRRPAATRATIFDHRVSPSDLAFVAAQTFHT